MEPFSRRNNRKAKPRKVCVFLAIGLFVAGYAERAAVLGVLSDFGPVAPRVQMVRRDGAISNPAILAGVTGAVLDCRLPSRRGGAFAFRADALLPMRVGRWIDAPMFVPAFAGTVLAGAPSDTVSGHLELRAASATSAIDLAADPNVLAWDRAEAACASDAVDKHESASGALSFGSIGIADGHACARTELGATLRARLATLAAIGWRNRSHRNTTAAGRTMGASLAYIVGATDRT